jgi:hypothetical protein
MPKCTDGAMGFGRLGRRVIEANFEGGDIGSDGGVLLLRRVDERIDLSRAAAAVLSDPRDPARITHSLRDLLAQRIYGLCCGYEDLNDHDTLRTDLLMQTAVGRVDALASPRLQARVQYAEAMLADEYEHSGIKQRLIDEFVYAADSWDIERRVITRLEHGAQGNNPRFVVTNLAGDAQQLYDRLYCQRGEAENRIKEAQLDLFGTRASCHRFAANQLRLLLAALAYTLMQRLRDLALKGSELERATAATIRVRLLKIGAAVVRNTRRVRILLASHHPLRAVFLSAARALAP